MALEIDVTVRRGAIAESRHRVTVAVVDSAGRPAAGTSACERTTSFRSSAKPFQLVPFVERGHADRFGASEADLAMMAASHTGSSVHLAHVQSLLDRLGRTPADLVCGYHEPADPESLEDVRRHPGKRSSLYNNCSGKHAGMLAFALAEGWPIEGYHLESHPLQQAMRRVVAECCGVTPESMEVGVDGCSVCVFGLPMAAMARGYARLAEAMAKPRDDARSQALHRIGRAMVAHPDLVEGRGQLATAIMQATSGRLVAKGGAEGLLLVGDVAHGWGVALKCLDGAVRAVGPAAVAVLEHLGLLTAPEAHALESFRRPVVLNAAGLEVGVLDALVRSGAGT